MREQAFSPHELSLVLNSITEYAIFTVDPRGCVTMWNEGAERVFGYTAPDIIGQSDEILFTPEDRALGVPVQELIDASRTGRASDERYHLRKDGSRFYASGLLFPVRNPSGDINRFVKVCRDLSDRKRWEQSLLEAQETLETRVAERTERLSAELAERHAAEQRARSLLSRLLTLQEEERRRIARDLHDHLGQQVSAVHLQLEILKNELQMQGHEAVHRLTTIQALFKQLDQDLDFFTWELRPGALYHLGLVPALTDFAATFTHNYHLPVIFECVGLEDYRLAQDIEINLYRIAQEALNNTYKHAKATRADIVLQKLDQRVILTVTDDGVGFVARPRDRRAKDRGMGLEGMTERASLIGGTLEIETAPNQGTAVIVTVPALAAEVHVDD